MVGSKSAATLVVLAICVATLANLGDGYVEASGYFDGIKSLFCGNKPTDYPAAYQALADHVYGATQSEELADNTREAASLIVKLSDAGQSELVTAFSQLKALTDDKGSLCGVENLANLRLVAEAMASSSDKTTDAVQRLNKVIVRYIAETSSVCFAHLEGKWAETWTPDFKPENGRQWISQLSTLPDSFLYEDYMTDDLNPEYKRYSLGSKMSTVLFNDYKLARKTQPNMESLELPDLYSEKALKAQINEYVHKPCKDFLNLNESKLALAPYNDLLISWYIISKGALEEFYKAQGLSPSVPATPFDGKDNFVFSHRACTRLLAMPSKEVAKLVISARNEKYQARFAS